MKMRRQHCVPLSRQVLEMLEVLHGLTGHGQFLFPSFRTSRRCMSENTVSAALRRLGYSREEMTAHGFRSTAATLLNPRSEEHTSALQSLLRISYAVFCLKKTTTPERQKTKNPPERHLTSTQQNIDRRE